MFENHLDKSVCLLNDTCFLPDVCLVFKTCSRPRLFGKLAIAGRSLLRLKILVDYAIDELLVPVQNNVGVLLPLRLCLGMSDASAP